MSRLARACVRQFASAGWLTHLRSCRLNRYTDDGDATEICRWTVDLAALPRFHYISQSGGGYVEFDLGLSLDSAEVRGALACHPHYYPVNRTDTLNGRAGVLMTDDGVDCGTASESWPLPGFADERREPS